jgi:glycosyltransferase involved in cell wall biosynthesis
MASGVPVIASNAGGLPDLIEDGMTGFVGPVGAVEEMAEAGASILADGKRWRAMSAEARRYAVERFSVDVIIPQYERYYERILGRGAHPEPVAHAASA